MYKGNRSRKKNKLDKDIQNEIEKNIIISNISNRSRLENRINKVNYMKNTRTLDKNSFLNESKLIPTLEPILIDIEIKENKNPIVYDLNKQETKEEKNEILEDIDKILMSRDINVEIDNYYNKYNEESSSDLEKDIDKNDKELEDFSSLKDNTILSDIECIKKDKDLICYGLLNKTELNELNNYLNKDFKKNFFMNKNTEILFSEKEDNSLNKELTFNPNIYKEIVGECKVKKMEEKSYYDIVIDNLYKLFTPK